MFVFEKSHAPVFAPDTPIERISRHQSRTMQLVIHLLSHLRKGRLRIILPDGHEYEFKADESGPSAVLNFHTDRVARRFLTGGKLGFCESYLDDEWSSPDIAALFELFLVNSQAFKTALMGKKWVRFMSRLIHTLRPNSQRGSRKNIYAHYDIGNDFYAAWLDPSMTYSAALFENENMTLEDAQEAKYAALLKQMDAQPHHHILEIGCGWGGFAEHAARTLGCRVTGITLSEAQHEYASEHMRQAGLADLVEIRLCDYRELNGAYDRIASIEMFEAVGEKYWPVYFQKLNALLKPGGQAGLQIITIRDADFESYRRSADYIQRYIFPGGMLPSQNRLEKEIRDSGLNVGPRLNFGKDYARTLQLWNERFQNAWPDLRHQKGFDTRFKRLWEQYLCYCEAGFRTGAIDVIHQNVYKRDASGG